MSATTVYSSWFDAAPEVPTMGGSGREHAGVVVQKGDLGLMALAEAEGPVGMAEIAASTATEQLCTHIGRHADIIERFARHQTPTLRSRLQAVLREGFTRAAQEVYALGLRRAVPLGVSMDAMLVLTGEAVVAHVGLGQVALLHDGLVHCLTGHFEPSASPSELLATLPGPDDVDIVDVELLGGSADVPFVQALTVSLIEGDRLLAVGASLAQGLPCATIRQLQGAENLDDLVASMAAGGRVGLDRPRLIGACQIGAPTADLPDRLAVLRTMDLFQWCTDAELLAFVGLTRPRRYRRGDLLLRQGSLNTTLFLLVVGRVGVNRDGQRIAYTGSGSIFGEMSMLDEPRASATVEALTDIEVLTIPRDAFLQALKGDMAMAVKVLWGMLLRVSANLRATSQRLAVLTAAGGLLVTDDAEDMDEPDGKDEPEGPDESEES
ncbi:MAG: cyclic nucleotide-binding domain-containing protein [Oligoflexia bacterium]|nr:cyclic nucleotide-binding domain-containing protein [Oligoflexia bacterium]